MGYSIVMYLIGLGLAVCVGMVALGWSVGRLVGFLTDDTPAQNRGTHQSLSGRTQS
jgi:hypothetical protein